MRGQFRLVHIGVAAAIAAATVTAFGLAQSVGAGTGSASVYVPIVPCRLLDTRPAPDTVGAQSTPLHAAEVVTFAVWGTNGNCTIPNAATGIATNATAVNPTATSYVTIYPADASPRPTASNLNVVAGSPPTPNQVTVGLSATGAISVYNNGGTLDLVIDIVGYYQPAAGGGVVNNDARYYTKDQIDAALSTKAAKPSGSTDLIVGPSAFHNVKDPGSTSSAILWFFALGQVALTGTNQTDVVCAVADVQLPNGATITKLAANVEDNSTTIDVKAGLYRDQPSAVTMFDKLAGAQTTGQPGRVSVIDSAVATPVVDTSHYYYYVQVCGMSLLTAFFGATISYTSP